MVCRKLLLISCVKPYASNCHSYLIAIPLWSPLSLAFCTLPMKLIVNLNYASSDVVNCTLHLLYVKFNRFRWTTLPVLYLTTNVVSISLSSGIYFPLICIIRDAFCHSVVFNTLFQLAPSCYLIPLGHHWPFLFPPTLPSLLLQIVSFLILIKPWWKIISSWFLTWMFISIFWFYLRKVS